MPGTDPEVIAALRDIVDLQREYGAQITALNVCLSVIIPELSEEQKKAIGERLVSVKKDYEKERPLGDAAMAIIGGLLAFTQTNSRPR